MIGDWHDIEKNVASEDDVKRFTSKDIGFNEVHEVLMLPCADEPLRQEGHDHRQTAGHQRVEGSGAEGVPSASGETRE